MLLPTAPCWQLLGQMVVVAFSAVVLVLLPVFRTSSSSSLRRCSPLRACQTEEPFDMNTMVTALNAAVLVEDYAEAGRLCAAADLTLRLGCLLTASDPSLHRKKLIADAAPAAAAATTWQQDKMPAWLLERLEQLGLRYPTPIQSAALQAPADAVLRAPTGSGKTVAFLCVLLARCDAELQVRCSHPVREAPPTLSPAVAHPRP